MAVDDLHPNVHWLFPEYYHEWIRKRIFGGIRDQWEYLLLHKLGLYGLSDHSHQCQQSRGHFPRHYSCYLGCHFDNNDQTLQPR